MFPNIMDSPSFSESKRGKKAMDKNDMQDFDYYQYCLEHL